jgi:hypothetical protein
MRRVRIVLGLAVALCAFGALSVPAFARTEKPKLVFGKFSASIVGKSITPSEPAKVIENKEDQAEVTGLVIGPYKFGVVIKKTGEIRYEEPCEKAPKITGKVDEEHSFSLLTEVTFRKCVSTNPGGGIIPSKASTFKLAIRFLANEAAEVGNAEGGLEISENAVAKIKGVDSECELVVPQQFVPGKAELKEEKFWEAAEYAPEKEENLENWEKNKKLREQYPGDFKDRLGIETTEKFKGIRSLVNTDSPKKSQECTPAKGEENHKVITEKEIEVEGKMVPNPYYLWTEYTNGKILMDAEGLEIKGGQLTFEPPA